MFPLADLAHQRVIDNERTLVLRAAERAVQAARQCCKTAGHRGLIRALAGLVERTVDSARSRLSPAVSATAAACCSGASA